MERYLRKSYDKQELIDKILAKHPNIANLDSQLVMQRQSGVVHLFQIVHFISSPYMSNACTPVHIMYCADAILGEITPLNTQQSIQDEMDATLSRKSLTSEQESVAKALISAKGIHAINGCPGAGKTFVTKWYVLYDSSFSKSQR